MCPVTRPNPPASCAPPFHQRDPLDAVLAEDAGEHAVPPLHGLLDGVGLRAEILGQARDGARAGAQRVPEPLPDRQAVDEFLDVGHGDARDDDPVRAEREAEGEGWLAGAEVRFLFRSPIVQVPGSLVVAAFTNHVARALLCQKAEPNGR